MDHQSILRTPALQTSLVKYACPSCREAIYTTPPLNVLMICTLCEEVLIGVELE